MNTMESLSSSHDELSNLSKQLQFHRELLINDPYIKHMKSSSSSPPNSQYFPYYALVEKYVAFADELNIKLSEFKELLMDSLEHKEVDDDDDDCDDDDSDSHSLSSEVGTVPTTPCTSISTVYDSYLPIIEEDKESVYSYNYSLYSDTDTDSAHFMFTSPIYCKTHIYISNTFDNDYDELWHLFVDIGALHRDDINDIVFCRDEAGYYYALVYVSQSMVKILCALEDIENYCNEQCINVKMSVLNHKIDSNLLFNAKQKRTLYITNFDVQNGHIYTELMQLFEAFGAVNSLEIVSNDNSSNTVYALLQFENIKNAVQCFTTHNVDGHSLYYGSRLLHIQYANV